MPRVQPGLPLPVAAFTLEAAALLAVTLAFNLLGDSVRDALDPTRGRVAGG